MKKYVLMSFLLFGQVSYAQTDMFVSLRPTVEKYLGSDIANKIWGVVDNVSLPEIPKVTSDAKSTSVYNKRKESITFPEDKMQQYNVAFVRELIESTREIKANRNELSKWMGTLSQGATREGVYRAMVLDSFYARLENYDSELSKDASTFAVKFLDKFTGKKIKASKLQSFNIYSIKRIVTERSLEVLDIYLADGDQGMEKFYDWYAVFSKELAIDYPIWDNKLRATSMASTHKRWAKKVPVQFIKSEVIIKLHKLFNNLQKRTSL